MEAEFLQRPLWDQLNAGEAEVVGRTLAHCLPEPWQFGGVAFFHVGDQQRHVAFYLREGRRFALIPGGPATLGYERGRPWKPTREALESWIDFLQNYAEGERPTPAEARRRLREFLDECLSPLREVRLDPFLLEVGAEAYGRREEAAAGGGRRIWERGVTLREVRAELAGSGFRLPTVDEWEYACSAGSRTLWRWGDDPLGQTSSEDDNPKPNAFGLLIAYDPYDQELCASGAFRGGDGGTAICGGEGMLNEALTVASWYRFGPDEEPVGEEEPMNSPHVRRAFTLPEGTLD